MKSWMTGTAESKQNLHSSPLAALEREGMRQQVEAINKKFEGVFNNTEYSYIVLDELNKIGSSKLSNETASLLRV